MLFATGNNLNFFRLSQEKDKFKQKNMICKIRDYWDYLIQPMIKKTFGFRYSGEQLKTNTDNYIEHE